MIEIRDLTFRYEKKSAPVLDGLSLSLETGKIGVLLGRNGSGKSTLLKVLLGLLKAEKGEVLADSENFFALSPREKAKRIAYVPQELNFGALSVYETVLLGRISRFGLFPGPEDDAAVRNALAMTGLAGFEQRDAGRLSGGEKQKVAIARALAQEANLLLFDEPTGNLDIANERAFLDTVKRLVSEKNITVLAVLHDLNRALSFGDRFFFMKEGRIAFSGGEELFTPELIYEIFDTHVRTETVDGQKIILEV